MILNAFPNSPLMCFINAILDVIIVKSSTWTTTTAEEQCSQLSS